MSNEGMSLTTGQGMLSAIFQGVSFSRGGSGLFVQLHTDHPGADGTDNIAVNNVRKDCTGSFSTDPTDDGSGHAQIVNDSIVGGWTAVPATEDYPFVSFWNAITGGTFQGSGVNNGTTSVTAGDDFNIGVGQLTATLPIAV